MHAKGLFLALMAALCFTLMGATAKLATPFLPESVLLFSRFSFGLLFLLPWAVTHPKTAFTTRAPGLHIIRITAALFAIGSYFYVLAFLPLATATLLVSTMPLFVPLVLRFFYHSPLHWPVFASILVGLLGVILLLHPSSEIPILPALIALFGGFCGAISIVMLRVLTKTDRIPTIIFYYFLSCTLFTGIIFFSRHLTHYPTIIWQTLFLLGAFSLLYQLFITKTFRYLPEQFASPLVYYSSVALAIPLGFILWHSIPNVLEWIGMMILVLGAILTMYLLPRVQ